MKLILNAFSLYFIIGHSVFDIGYSNLKLIAMGRCPRLTSFTPSGLKNKECGNIEMCQLLVSAFEAMAGQA
jgi:hypothetical protein